ncbi:MAG: bifunctional 3-(3-hydroxy-phenyl)propionate/3-hydroxycinnamic acid hydroxylase [Pseudomonadota bacterium]
MLTYDVVIAGYGPTGAVAANLLGRQGLNVLVVEPSLEIYDIPRAVHFDGEVMRIFQHLDLEGKIYEVAAEGVAIGFTNGKNWPLFYQDLSLIHRHHGWFNGLFFNQPRLEQHLRQGVERYTNAEVKLGWTIEHFEQTDDGVEAQLKDIAGTAETVSCRYLLGCDGASSTVRKLLNIPQEDLECDEPWLVCDLILDEGTEVERTAYQICDPARPTTLVPCEGTHIRWEFMLNDDDDIAEIEDEANVRAMMAPHLHRLSPALNSQHGELIRAKVYNFHALIAETFQQDRVFLLGDAAHQTPPFLGQGMCAGIRDAYNLSWKLIGILNGNYTPELLNTYTTERRPHVYEVITSAVNIGDIIQTRNPVKAFLRDSYLMLGKVFPPLVGMLKFGEGWNIGSGLLSIEDAPKKGAPIGYPIPQAMVQPLKNGESGAAVWSDELLGEGFTLLGFGVDPAALLDSHERTIKLAGLHIGPDGQAIEVNGELTRWAEEHDIALAVVRPDRHVYGVCKLGGDLEAQLEALLSNLQHQLGV